MNVSTKIVRNSDMVWMCGEKNVRHDGPDALSSWLESCCHVTRYSYTYGTFYYLVRVEESRSFIQMKRNPLTINKII